MVYALIFVLTVFDVVCTYIGVSNGYIEEGNWLMAKLFEINVLGTCIFVVLVTGLLIMFVRKKAKEFRWIQFAVLGVLAVKIVIASLHVVWLIYV